jgi:hypothetical protein
MGDPQLICALLALALVLTILVVAVAARRRREGYLVYPYLDLDEPGVRGSPYAMTTCA